MIEIKPAIIPRNLNSLKEASNFASGKVKFLHVDMCDGEYVKNKSWPYHGYGEETEFAQFGDNGIGLPNWEELDYEIDLMVADPLKAMNDWIRAGASSFIVHGKGLSEEKFEELLNTAKGVDANFILAINPDEDISMYEEWIKKADVVECMGIVRIGFQGESLDERVFEQIKKIKSLDPEKIVQADGGINEETRDLFIDAGADILVVGSAIFGDSDPQAALEALQED